MESGFQKTLKRAMKYPVLFIVSSVVALFCLIAFVLQVFNLFAVLGWFADMLVWYLGDIGYFFGNIGDVFGNAVHLVCSGFYTLQFLGTLALIGLLFGYITGIVKESKKFNITLAIAAVAASYIMGPIYEIFSGLPLFSGIVAFLYRFHNILPMNLVALVTVVFLLRSIVKKKTVKFSLYLYIAGGIQILFAILHIIGSIIIGSIQFIDVLTWAIDLFSPVLFVFMGCMIEERLTGKKVLYVDKIIDAVNGVQFNAPKGTSVPAPEPQPSVSETPAAEEQSAPETEQKTDATV